MRSRDIVIQTAVPIDTTEPHGCCGFQRLNMENHEYSAVPLEEELDHFATMYKSLPEHAERDHGSYSWATSQAFFLSYRCHCGHWGHEQMTEKRVIVKNGYNKIAREYQANRHIFDNVGVLKEFSNCLPKNARILDAGCGAGVPCARLLVQAGFEVVGVDFSASMLKLAKKSVPEAILIKEDLTRLGFRDNSFDGLVALYSIIHVPREMHASLYQSFHRILKPDGVMLICIGSDEWEGEDDYFGARMFWSEYSHEEAVQIVTNAGIQIISGKHLMIGGERHYWILGRNRKHKLS